MVTKKPIIKSEVSITGWAILLFILFAFTKVKSQVQQQDTTGATRFIDSLEKHTSMKQMQQYLFESVSARFYAEGKFIELYNWYIDRKITEWLQRKQKPK